MGKILGFKLNLYNICMIVLMAVFNILLNQAAMYLNNSHVPMPLWLDSVGIFIAAIEAGPIAGAIAGFPVYGVYILSDHHLAAFSINSMLIGISAGVLARTIGLDSWKKAFLAGLTAALIDIVLSSYFDLSFYKGLPGFLLGDNVFKALVNRQPLIFASLAAEAAMSVPDKIFSAILASMICTDYYGKTRKKRI